MVSRPFGAAAQAGFGIGQRVLQASFLPVVALGFAVGPVAGQNFGARKADRVRATFTSAASLATGVMLVLSTITWLAAAWFIRIFSSDAAVVAAGEEYSTSLPSTSWRLARFSSAPACSRRWATPCRRW